MRGDNGAGITSSSAQMTEDTRNMRAVVISIRMDEAQKYCCRGLGQSRLRVELLRRFSRRNGVVEAIRL